MNQSEFLEITWNLLKLREKSRVQGAIGSGWKTGARFLSQSLKVETVNCEMTFDSHL